MDTKKPTARDRMPPGSPGRPKGVPNTNTKLMKAALMQAFDAVGGVAWLIALAELEPRAFAMLLAKLIPPATEENGEVHFIIAGGFTNNKNNK